MSKKKGDISREEIAKQFLLPERQSKIDTLLKQDGQAYCICRSSDSSRFMIACDACEEWYHGDCIGISEKQAKLIRQYFCVRCQQEDPTLQTRWRSRRERDRERDRNRNRDRDRAPAGPAAGAPATPAPAASSSSSSSVAVAAVAPAAPAPASAASSGAAAAAGDERRSRKRRDNRHADKDKKAKKCGECVGCYRTEDCGRCEVCARKHRHGAGGGGGGRQRERCKQRVCVNFGGGIRRKRRDSSSDLEQPSNAHLQTEHARQCYGPTCAKSARFGSKYCSDECGLKLATNRILQVLPQRLQEWALSPSVAEDKNIKALDLVRRQQLEVRQILHELDKRHRELDAIVERAKNFSVDPGQEFDGEEEAEMSTYCITCGHEIHSRTAIKHMEKCFNKYESQASFGSVFKTRIEGNNMFCDFYNPINRTYCKRLRVLCPEHCKDPKIADNEVCGCPLVTNVFALTGEFCRAPKKSCVRHYVWEKLRRAEIDLERVRQWLKMDELLEKERQIRTSMASRAGVLALMLHSTYNHELMEQITKASQQDQHAVQRELAKRFSKVAAKQRTS